MKLKTFEKKFISLDIELEDGLHLYTIRLDDGQTLTITKSELKQLKEILNENSFRLYKFWNGESESDCYEIGYLNQIFDGDEYPYEIKSEDNARYEHCKRI